MYAFDPTIGLRTGEQSGGGLFKDPKIQFYNLGLEGGENSERFKRRTLPGLMELTGHLYEHQDASAIALEVQEEMIAEANLLQAAGIHRRHGGAGSVDELPNGDLVTHGTILGTPFFWCCTTPPPARAPAPASHQEHATKTWCHGLARILARALRLDMLPQMYPCLLTRVLPFACSR